MPTPNVAARPAATVMLIRDGVEGIEVLMVRRHGRGPIAERHVERVGERVGGVGGDEEGAEAGVGGGEGGGGGDRRLPHSALPAEEGDGLQQQRHPPSGARSWPARRCQAWKSSMRYGSSSSV